MGSGELGHERDNFDRRRNHAPQTRNLSQPRSVLPRTKKRSTGIPPVKFVLGVRRLVGAL